MLVLDRCWLSQPTLALPGHSVALNTVPVNLLGISPFAMSPPEDIVLSERGLPASLCAQGDMHHQGEAVQRWKAAGVKVSPLPRIWGTLWVLGMRHRRVGGAALFALWYLETPMPIGMKM